MPNTPLFFLQIIDRDGVVAQLPGGGLLEADLIDVFTKAIMAKGVGFFRTESHVELDIQQGIKDALFSLKDQTKFIV